MAARWLGAVALMVALAACGQSTPRTQAVIPALGPTARAGRTFVGNSFSGTNDDSVSHSVMELSVSPDGYAIMGTYWEEANHDARLFEPNTGAQLSPTIQTNDHKGIWGVAADTKYIYYVTGDGQLWRSSRASWDNPAHNLSNDNGHDTAAAPLIVDSRGHQLMGLAECGNELFVSDPNGPLGSSGQVSPNTTAIKVVPTNLSAVTASWSVPRARTIACDKEGNIWVLQQGVAAGPGPDLQRFTPSGRLLTSFALPAGVYPEGLAADPTRARLLVPDNGPDQNFKWFDYSGHQIGQLGATGGYLAGPDPGVIGPSRFVGPRAAAIDPNGNVFTAESANPGAGQAAWADNPSDPGFGPAAIFTKFSPTGSVVWRVYGLDWGPDGEPTPRGSRFFDAHFEYARDANGNYQPYAYTVNPFTNPTDPRFADPHGTVNEREIDGHRYLVEDPNGGSTANLYEQQPSSEIFKPVVAFRNNTDILTNGNDVSVSTNGSLADNHGIEDFWMADSGDVWSIGYSHIWRYRVQGFTSDGTPRYDFRHIDAYPFPPQIAAAAHRIEVDGNTVYVSGFSSSDPNPSNDWGGWKSAGRHLLKFTSLPTSSGWPAPAWEYNFSYGTGQPSSTNTNSPNDTGMPISFVGDGGYVGVGWDHDPKTASGEVFILNDRNGTLVHTYSPPVPGWGHFGWLDAFRSLTARNGWIWVEDDGQTKIYGLCPTSHCT